MKKCEEVKKAIEEPVSGLPFFGDLLLLYLLYRELEESKKVAA